MRDAVIVDAVRTPVGKRNGALAGVHPANLSAHVDASTFSGDIHSDFGKAQTKEHGPGSSLDAKVGDGDAQIEMQSFSGDLELRKND